VLSCSLGVGTIDFEVDLFERELQPGDKLLLCSDGLWQAFPDLADLAWWLGLAEPSADLCRRLVLEANRRDGSDNISAVVVRAEESPDRPRKPSTPRARVQ
jgi:protein phosphatase